MVTGHILFPIMNMAWEVLIGRMGGIAVRALASRSHQCDPGLNPARLCIVCN